METTSRVPPKSRPSKSTKPAFWTPQAKKLDFDESRPAQLQGLDWFFAHRETRHDPLAGLENKHQAFLELTWPAGNGYSSPLSPIFAATQFDLSRANRRHKWMARDGFLPLLWFFEQNPTPGDFQNLLLVDEDLQDAVPEGWHRRVGTYRIETIPQKQKTPSQNLHLIGLVNEIFFTPTQFASTLGRLSISKNYKKISATLFDRYDPTARVYRQHFFANYSMGLVQALQPHLIDLMDWQSVESSTSFAGVDLLELNNKFIYTDSNMTHSLLMKGASLVMDDPVPRKGGTFVALSPFHGIRYWKSLDPSRNQTRVLRSLNPAKSYFRSTVQEKGGVPENSLPPWPAWFRLYAKTVFEALKKS